MFQIVDRHKDAHISLQTGMFKLSKKLNSKKLLYSYMDDLYPGMIIPYTSSLSTAAELYIYGSFVIGILAAIVLGCIGEPRRVYRTMKRKNTDESPIIQV